MREHDYAGPHGRRRRFDDDEPYLLKRRRGDGAGADLSNEDSRLVTASAEEHASAGQTGGHWSSWDAPGVLHGPEPWPDWVVTELAAVDTELGILKTGKEADVHLVDRAVPGTGRGVLLAAKRYRSPEHRLFHRDASYTEGRRVRESRVTRAMANRTAFGRSALAGQWAAAEFAALSQLWQIGVEYGAISVPYPVQLLGTELMLEFIGDPDGTAAPRLAQLRPDRDELAGLWRQLVDALTVLARCGLAHGDLSPYNLLVHKGRLVLIDLPQVVDVVSNPAGREYLVRDVTVVARWFAARGQDGDAADPQPLIAALIADAGIR